MARRRRTAQRSLFAQPEPAQRRLPCGLQSGRHCDQSRLQRCPAGGLRTLPGHANPWRAMQRRQGLSHAESRPDESACRHRRAGLPHCACGSTRDRRGLSRRRGKPANPRASRGHPGGGLIWIAPVADAFRCGTGRRSSGDGRSRRPRPRGRRTQSARPYHCDFQLALITQRRHDRLFAGRRLAALERHAGVAQVAHRNHLEQRRRVLALSFVRSPTFRRRTFSCNWSSRLSTTIPARGISATDSACTSR